MEYRGRSVLRLTSTARSSPFISRIYPVEDSAESLWDPAGGFSRRYRIRQREGRYRRQLEIFLNQEERMALYYRNQDSRRIFFIPHGVQDALSTLFKFRTFPASVGSWRTVPTFASRRSWDVEVEVEAREVIETPWGKLPALRVKPKLRYQGIFRHMGDVLIWVTDDPYHVPLQMKSRVLIGHFTATIIEAHHLPEASLLAQAIRRKAHSSPKEKEDDVGKEF